MEKDYSYLLNEEARKNLTRKIASEGFVLLKNDEKVLPFKESDCVAVFGRTQIDTLKGGIGSSSMEVEDDINILTGLENSNINIYKPLAEKYKKWVCENPILNFGIWGTGMPLNPEMPIEESEIKAVFDSGANKAVIVLGRMAGENTDVVLSRGDFYLSDEEEALFGAVSSVFSDVVVILNTTGIVDLSFIEKYNIKSVLYINMCGLEGGNAVADVLSGAVTPSGKLTDTVAFNYSDYPSSNYFGQERGGIIQDYFEDIYVGYRYFETFDGAKEKVRYPFGYGLSYTIFDLCNFSFEETEEEIFISANIKNIGDFDGKETLQVYFCPPLPCQGAKLYKPKMNLCGFVKTKLLKSGESQTVYVSLKKSDMASFDDTGISGHCDCFVLEAGEYRFFAGTSVFDAAKHLVGSFIVDDTIVTEKCHRLATALKERLLGNGETETLETIPVDVLEGVSVGFDICEVDRNLYALCDGDKDNLHCEERVEYRFQISTSGGYTLSLSLDQSLASKPLADIFKLEISGREINLCAFSTDQNANTKISGIALPIGRADFIITSLCESLKIKSISIQKEIKVCTVPSLGEVKLDATDFFECAFRTGADRYTDINGNSGSYIYNLNRPSNFINYKLVTDEAGIYEVKFSYSNSCKGQLLNSVAAIFVSNVGQSVENIEIKNTCKAGEFNFTLSDSIRITLPKGESYFKIVSASLAFPDLEYILIKRSANQDKKPSKTSLSFTEISEDEFPDESTSVLVEPDVEKRGIQLIEVCKDPSLMKAFLEQLSNQELATLVSGSAPNRTETGTTGTTSPLYDRGVTPVQTADGPMGLRLRTTSIALPSCTILASSFNTELAYEMGVSYGFEAKKHEVDCVLGPALNIHRDIRCGRNFEYFSEDPLVSGKFAAAVVNGLQSVGVSAMAKHYAANSCEHERLKSNSRVSARALREIYLKGFEILIKEAQPHSIMSSYNYVNNTKICEDYNLITVIPREEWGYKGVFATDWINDSNHVRELLAGHDLKMNEGDVEAVCAALSDGRLSREQVAGCAQRVLEFVMKSDYFRKKFNI